LGPTRGGYSAGEDDGKSSPECALQSRQKHSILSLLNLISDNEDVKGYWKSSDGT